MNAQQLKNSILQEAITGKLVPQNPNDVPASVLLDKIRKEKARLVKEGKLKKKDLEETPISEDEKPFEIPESWVWCKLGTITTVLGGKRIPAGRKLSQENTGHIYIRVSDMKEETVSTDNLLYVPVDIFPSISRYIINKEDVYVTVAGTIGKIGKIPPELDGANLTENADRLVFSNISQDWLIRCLQSPFIQLQITDVTTKVGQPKLAILKIQNLLIPLPPLAEQHRIVAKIEELLPKVEEYGKAQEALDKLNEELPEKLKKSILQEAISGKLVPQDPNDEPASVLLDKIRKEKARLVKEGKLKKKDLEETPISEDEKPFEIPESWEWVRLENITTYICRGKSPVYSEIKKYPIVAQKCNQWSGFSLEKAKFADPQTIDKYTEERLLKDGDLLWNSTGLGTLGRMAIYSSSVNQYGWAVADSHVTVIRTLPVFCNYQFLFYYFASAQVQNVIEDKADGSTKQKELYQETIKKYEVPLPPLAEQHRIVAKIEQLMKEIDKLKNKS